MPTAKTPALLPELQAFVETIGPDIPYEKLLDTAAEAGWQYRLVQNNLVPMPDATLVVTFDVSVGREDKFEHFDTVSIRLPATAGPVSFAARLQLTQTLIFLFFGRLPPQPQREEEQAIDMTGREDDIVLPGEDPLPDEGGEYVNGAAEEEEELDLIARREADGVPIFRDLYELGADTDATIDAFIEQMGAYLKTTSSLEQLGAVYTKNAAAIQFISDLGDDQDKADLKTLFDQRKEALSIPNRQQGHVPRRRARAH